jgi:YVTN family beta-propeller protein
MPAEVAMIMANIFLRAKRNRADRHETPDQVATLDQDLTAAGSVAVQRGPIGDLAVDADSNTIVVTNYGDNSVSVIDTDTMAIEDTIAVVGEPFAATAANDRAYITTTSASYDAISVIDTTTKTVIASYPLAFSVTAVAVSPDGKRVFAGRTGPEHVDIAVIDVTAERVGTIDVAQGPGISIDAVRVDPSGKRVYAATSDARGSRLVVVNAETARVDANVGIGAPIRDLALGADGTAYVLTSDLARRGVVHIVDLATNKVRDGVESGAAPTQLVLSPDGTRVYIVDYDEVAVLCTLTNEVINSVKVGAQPSCVAMSADGSRLYVADYAGKVTAFSVASTMSPMYSRFLATDPIAIPEVGELEATA